MSANIRLQAGLLLLLSVATAADAQAQRGTISGKVSYAGPVLTMQLDVPEDVRQYCPPVVPKQLRAGAVGNVVVFLEGMPSVAMKGSPVEVRNVNCAFEPALQVAETGATLVLVNQDPMMHTVQLFRSELQLGEFVLGSKGGNTTNRRMLSGAGRIDVQCRYHGWMKSNIWVFDHPYHALTATDGTFQIPFVAPGTYRLTVWHSSLGTQTREITVAADQTATIDFVYQRALGQ